MMFLPLQRHQVANKCFYFHIFDKYFLFIEPAKPKLLTKTHKKKKEDFNQLFADLGEINKDPKPQPPSPTSSAIGDMRKAVLSQDIDPTVLKVKIHFN